MRAMTEWRRRLRASGRFEDGRLMLFFGARTQEELPYFGPLQNLPRYCVQDAMRACAADLGWDSLGAALRLEARLHLETY